MRAVFPDHSESVDLVDAYSIPAAIGPDEAFVRCNMISTFDGAITLNGKSGSLGGPADRRVFQTLRSVCDVVLVGAGTARVEGYGPARLDDELRERRRSRGQPPVPPIAVVTRSGNLDWSSPFFTEAEARPIVITSEDIDENARERAGEVAGVLVAGEKRVDPALAIDRLLDAGYRSVLLEGGPRLNSDVLHAGRMDELCLTLSPHLAGGAGLRMFAGPEFDEPLELTVVQVLEEDGFLFCRLRLPRPVQSRGADAIRQWPDTSKEVPT